MAIIKPLQSITLKNDNGEDTTYVVASAPAIVETTDPADVASFADGAEGIPVKSLLADINPVQNLNGQSAPYPAGGGKNLINDSIRYKTGNRYYIGNQNAYTTSLAAGTYTFSVEFLNGSHYGAFCQEENGSSGVTIWGSTTTTSSATITLSAGNYMFWLYKSGGATEADIGHVQLEKGSSASAYQPYSNICPITGWTGMNVVMTGKNLCPTATITLGNGSPRTADIYFAEPLPIGTYTFSASVTTNTTASANAGVQFITLTSNAGSATMPVGTTGTLTKTITVTKPIRRLYFYIGTTDYNNGKTIVFENIQFEVGSPATAYEPYAGTTYPISWSDEAGTVYGGYLDVVTGLLTVTHGSDVYNGTTSSVVSVGTSSITGNHYAIVDLTLKSRATSVSNVGGAISNMLAEGVTPTAQGKFSIIGSEPNVKQASLVLPDQTITTKSAFDTYLQSNPITLVYPLATPQTYQLTPQGVTTLLGQNNIWADTGDVEVDYCADTKLYINKIIAES